MYVNEIKNQQSRVINDSKPDLKRPTQNKCIKTEWYTKTVRMLQVAGKIDSTQKMYARSVRQLIEFYNKEPTQITERQLEDYFLHRRNEDKWTPSTLKISYCGIKFFIGRILVGR